MGAIKRLIAFLPVLASFLWPASGIAAPCQFVLGFATLAVSVPQVGECVEDQHYSANGDAQQATTGGLMAWRRADNWTAFTDGYMTWINGPNGVVGRLNSDRFPWEAVSASQGPSQSSALDRAPSPWTTATAPPGTAALGVQWIEISHTEGGKIIAAVARPPGDGPFPVVVILHGSHGFAVQYVQLAKDIARGGFIAVAGCWFGGRLGFPQSAGIACPDAPGIPEVSDPQVFRDVTVLVSAARTLPGVRADRLGLFGHSLGGSAALIFASGAPSVQAVVTDSAGYPLAKVAQLGAPLLILHGAADSKGPATDVRSVRAYEAAARALGKPVDAVYYPGADHNDMFLVRSQYSDELQRVTAFFGQRLLAPA